MVSRVARILLGVAVLVLLLTVYNGDYDLGDGPPPTPAPPAGEHSSGVLSQLAGLEIAEEPARVGYSRDLFSHWNDPDGNGCDARQDALIDQAIAPVQRDLFGCHVVEGDWYSVFDAVTYSGPAENVDIDHMVSLAEAWDSGADTWTNDQRTAFANDPANLLVVTATSNRSKGASDLAEWQPPQHDAWCLTATITIETKDRWDLSIDQAEHQQLEEMARTCDEHEQQTHPAANP